MPDVAAGSWASIANEEFINSQRTIAYVKNFGVPIKITDDCWCEDIQKLLGDCPATTGLDGQVLVPDFTLGAGPDGAYQFPSTDPAPWYDPAIPESGDFLGFLPTEFDGLGSTYSRQTFDVIDAGAVLGRLQPKARTLTWRGYLFGRTCCAAEYGLRWLTARLAEASGCEGCAGSELDILLCCPEVTGQEVNRANTCGLDSEAIPDVGISKTVDAFRTFYRTGLIDGPRRLSERKVGCGGNCDDGPGCLIEVEFSLVAGNPFMHKDPVTVCEEQNFPDCNECVEWIKVNTPEECEDLLDCGQSPIDCLDDPNCERDTLPTIPPFVDDCGCESIAMSEICCAVSNDIYGQFFEGVPQIEVFSGSKPLYNVTVRVYENPQERTCEDEDLFDICNLCDFITIRYVPANSTLTVDGLTRTVDIECPGNNVNAAESLTVSPFSWPIFKCIDYIVKVAADCCGRDPITSVRRLSNGINISTFNGDTLPPNGPDNLYVNSTAGFPSSGTITVTLDTGNGTTKDVVLSYSGITDNSFTGVNSNNQTGVLSTGDKVTADVPSDPNCENGIADDATVTLRVIPREM